MKTKEMKELKKALETRRAGLLKNMKISAEFGHMVDAVEFQTRVQELNWLLNESGWFNEK